jgi:predicted metal-dependent hydrolase
MSASRLSAAGETGSGEIAWDVGAIFEHVLRRLHRGPGAVPRVDVQYRPFAGMNHRASLRNGLLTVHLSDLLHGADARVIEALATILLAKLYRRTAPEAARLRYRRYVMSRGVEQRIIETRRQRGRKTLTDPRGRCYDLSALFAELNASHFADAIPATKLSWSARASRVRLGHYDIVHHAIVLNCSLDRPNVPRVVVEYILYHEMLHVKHPVESAGGRRRIHPPAFRAEEKRFSGYAEARAVLRKLALADDVD